LIIHTAGLFNQSTTNGRQQIKLEWSWIAYEVNSTEQVRSSLYSHYVSDRLL
jgi:hypothetical protein